jgi:hypothetical protein
MMFSVRGAMRSAALVVPYLRGVVVRGNLAIIGERLQVLGLL